MLRHAFVRATLIFAASSIGCTTSQSGDMDAGTEPDASLPEPTGFFQVALVGERWLFITPDGEPFYSVGVNHVTNNNNTDTETGVCPYCEAVGSTYENEEAWAEATAERLEQWGFNTIGGWSREDLFSPLMATEFSFRSSESDPPNTYPPIYLTFDTQVERAAAYDEYVQNCFDAPYIVGHHWFEYVDQPVGGRGDGEDNNFGLVTVSDEPYQDFVEPVTVTNLRAPRLHK